MAATRPWSSLLPGLIAIAILTAAVVAVLSYGGIGGVRGDTTRLYVATSQAQGVMKGTEVWLAGQKVGVVQEVGFRSPGRDTLARVILALDVRSDDLAQIRRDSDIRVRAGASIVGPIVVYITAGTPTSGSVRAGDTLFATGQSDFQLAASRLDDATKNLDPIKQDVRTIGRHLRSTSGTTGAMLADRERGRGAFGQMKQLGARMDDLKATMARRPPTGDFAGSARRAMARVDSIRTLLASDGTSFGRFRRDSTLSRAIASVRDELSVLRTHLNATDGTLGRLRTDSALTLALAEAQREMALLFEDLKRRPLRYIAF